MLYERAIAHPKLRNEVINVKWSKGYKLTELWYRGRLLKRIEGFKALQQKVIFDDAELGKVEVFLAENPFIINIKVDDIHSPENAKHPKKNIKYISYWLIIGLLFHLAGVVLLIVDGFIRPASIGWDEYFIMYHSFLTLCFLIPIILIRLNAPMYFLIGMIAYYAQGVFLVSVAILSTNGSVGTVRIVASIYVIYCVLLIFPIRRLIQFMKHKPFDFTRAENILDD